MTAKELNCLKCHAIGSAGGRVGSDMVNLGSAAQIDGIAESLLAPNKKVKEKPTKASNKRTPPGLPR